MVKINFLGACKQVGRSQFEINTGELDLLLDAGSTTFEGKRFPLPPEKQPDAVILSHAHLDHSGSLPMLYKSKSIPFYCTFPTLPLVNLLWNDILKLTDIKNDVPYISEKEIASANQHCICLPYDKQFDFYDGTSFQFLNAGHIPGSAQILVEKDNKRILYTADFNTERTELQESAKPTELPVDSLIIESTYANRDHPPREEVESDFINSIKSVLDDGNALVPCFAIGRTQEILLILEKSGIDAQIYVDGMGTSASNIISEYPSYLKDPKGLQSAISNAVFISDHSERKKISSTKGKIIIATAGMLEGGPSMHYIQKMSQNQKGGIFLTGYQVDGTNGRLLMEKNQIRDHGKVIDVKIPAKSFDFSAHSGKQSLINYISRINPSKVYCVHGDEPSCIGLANEVNESLGISAFAPTASDSHEV